MLRPPCEGRAGPGDHPARHSAQYSAVNGSSFPGHSTAVNSSSRDRDKDTGRYSRHNNPYQCSLPRREPPVLRQRRSLRQDRSTPPATSVQSLRCSTCNRTNNPSATSCANCGTVIVTSSFPGISFPEYTHGPGANLSVPTTSAKDLLNQLKHAAANIAFELRRNAASGELRKVILGVVHHGCRSDHSDRVRSAVDNFPAWMVSPAISGVFSRPPLPDTSSTGGAGRVYSSLLDGLPPTRRCETNPTTMMAMPAPAIMVVDSCNSKVAPMTPITINPNPSLLIQPEPSLPHPTLSANQAAPCGARSPENEKGKSTQQG